MADEKKLNNEEITDEQANDAAGGLGIPQYDCQGGCGKHYYGVVPFWFGGRACCANCYAKKQQQQSQHTARR